jgi:ATP-binding cassette subfamily F protein 3
LSLALQEYEGAMILITHDRFLVRMTTDQLLLIANGKLQTFDGDLDDYGKWLFEFRKQQNTNIAQQNKSESSRKEQRQKDAKQRELRRPLLQKIKLLEEQLDKLQKQATAIEKQLSDHSLYEVSNKDILQDHLLKQANIKKAISSAEEAWLSACDERDRLDAEKE